MSTQKVDDSSLILTAASKGSDPKASRVLKSFRFPKNDPIFGSNKDPLAKQMRRQAKWNEKQKKGPSTWNNSDFLRYMRDTLALYQVELDDAHTHFSRTVVEKIYDSLVHLLDNKMSPSILKAYFDWWVSLRADSYRGRSIHINMLMERDSIKNFASRFTEVKTDPIPQSKPPSEFSQSKEFMDKLYSLGGAKFMLMNDGIVKTYSYLTSYHPREADEALNAALASLAAPALEKVIELTIKDGPYDPWDWVDFVSKSKPFLNKYSITKFDNVDVSKCFSNISVIEDNSQTQ